VQIAETEQNPIVPERPWRVLADRTRSRSVRWEIAPDRLLFEGQHHGYAHRPSETVCRRRFIGQLGETQRRWHITDELIGRVPSRSRGAFISRRRKCGTSRVRRPPRAGAPAFHRPAFHLRTAGFELTIGESQASDRYGVCYQRPCLVLAGVAELPARFDMIFTAQD